MVVEDRQTRNKGEIVDDVICFNFHRALTEIQYLTKVRKPEKNPINLTKLQIVLHRGNDDIFGVAQKKLFISVIKGLNGCRIPTLFQNFIMFLQILPL